MSVPTTLDVFTRICRSVEEQYADTMVLCGPADARTAPCGGGEPISLEDLRSRARSGDSVHLGRTAAWGHIAHHLREEAEAEGERSWMLITVWLLAPRLRGAAYSIARCTGAERADVGSALLQGALEGARTIKGVGPADIEKHLIDAAFAVGWQTGRRGSKETPVEEWNMVGEETGPQPMTRTPGAVVRVDVMSRTLAQQAQGERLGALAYRLGLLSHVRQVRRTSRSRPRRPRDGARRTPSEQPCLFEMWGSAHEASS
ncbi:hypothetical protein EYS09_19005 [Streptomyces kasugaensis]|uniref:Uncharacterized protein n=2 Tax=Streptomyces kasugaensis TaxID=1946 RepID=A0A4Q9HSV6_STRKA|nr:hypothetical protein EYS09_19005 [Streptomyces kasugaensis]